MSAGNSASKSSTRTIPPAFSRNTISSPRRKISTSELLTRNFFGSLTAWLFPDLNTRAMAMICLSSIYTAMYIHLQAPISASSSEQIDAVRSRHVDAGFVFSTPKFDPDLDQLKVAIHHLVLAAPTGHPLTKLRKLRLLDLSDTPFVWFPRWQAPWPMTR